MAHHKCEHCGNSYHWSHAFAKFGYDDGDGNIETIRIAQLLESKGYRVKYARWNLHNMIIFSIEKDGIEYMPRNTSKYLIGYDDPQKYLPVEILTLLNTEFPSVKLFY